MADEQQVHGQQGGSHVGSPRGPGGHDTPHEEREGAPEWMISFADNVMLQMGFFVILLALSMQASRVGGTANRAGEGDTETRPKAGPTPEQLDWAIAVREAFNNPVDPSSSDPNDYLLVQRVVARRGQARANTPGQSGAEHDVKSIRPSDYTGLGGTVPFEQDSAELHEAAQAAIAEMLPHVRGHRNILELRGHASAPEAFAKPDRGMRLSYERARAVAEGLAAAGMAWDQLRLVACGGAERTVRQSHAPQEHRADQRVEVIVTDQAPPDPDAAAEGEAPP